MMFMTAKVDMKKTLLALAAVVALIVGLIVLFGGNNAAPTTANSVSGNDARVQFLKNFGWEVSTSPVESGQVRIPEKSAAVT